MPKTFAFARRTAFATCLFLTAGVMWSSRANANDANSDDAAERFFEEKIRPLLIEHCYECHSIEAGDSSGELRVDDAPALRRGGTRGPAVVPGDPQASLLVRAVTYDDVDLQMPPEQKLSDEHIELLRQWVQSGAFDPRQGSNAPAEPSEEVEDPRDHWAFQPAQPAPTPTDIAAHATDVIDAVVAERLAKETELAPSELADRATLLRRVSFDLTGLPPSRELAHAFLGDDSPDAYTRLVDRLLASPAFGERWARHWMDVARYADTVGYTLAGRERRLFGSERYRDWLIRSFNDDLPFDDMVRYQLAADYHDPEGKAGHLDAMGFLTVGRRYLSKHDILDDRIDVVSRGLLGMTVTCARCHDHKFDPIPTTDYYALYGIFNSSQADEGGKDSPWPLRMTDIEKPHDAVVFRRGQPGNRGPRVPRRFVSILEPEEPETFSEGSGRRQLAEKIADPQNPLTARVYVNRVWQHLLGKSLVESPSDFGVRTEPPKHPEVLDDLAVRFVERGWSTKQLVRRIVMTHVYRQSSAVTPESLRDDPDNLWLARANRRRLDFEALRDSVLTASGRLEPKLGGEPVPVLSDPTPPRRTVYAFVDRQELPGVFRAFDFASPDAHAPQRYFTTVPQQALYLMNNTFAVRAAGDILRELRTELPASQFDDQNAFIDALYQRVLRRSPREAERQLAAEFLQTNANPLPPRFDPRRFWQYGIATINEEGIAESFQPFPHYKDGRYSGGEPFPHPEWNYSSLTANGGHPGPGAKFAVVRRILSQWDGTVTVYGHIEHGSKQGDGIRVTVNSGNKCRWRVVVSGAKRPFGPLQFPVRAGETIDLIVDDNGTTSFDSFRWTASVRIDLDTQNESTAEPQSPSALEFDTEGDFSGPLPPAAPTKPLTRRAQLAQVLLMSNEFCFVD